MTSMVRFSGIRELTPHFFYKHSLYKSILVRWPSSSNRLLKKFQKMSLSTKKRYFIANWKMNLTFEEVKSYAYDFTKSLEDVDVLSFFKEKEIIIIPSFIYLTYLREILIKNIVLGAQDISPYKKGSFTGEVSGIQLKSIGVHYVLIGHSERRQSYVEENHLLMEKCLQAWEAGLVPIFCIGESLSVREEGKTLEFILSQVSPLLSLFNNTTKPFSLCPFLIAYEPVWAIGTGKGATINDVVEVALFLKSFLQSAIGDQSVPILYGGSVTSENASEFLSNPLIDGLLVGGSSLIPDSFLNIIKAI